MPLLFILTLQNPIIVLVIPDVRKLTVEEKNFASNKGKDLFLDKLDKLEFSGGVAYVSMPEWQSKAKKQRRKLAKDLSAIMSADGNIDVAKLNPELKSLVYESLFGKEPKDPNYKLPTKLEASYEFSFKLDGQKFDVDSSKPWGNASASNLRSISELFDTSQDNKAIKLPASALTGNIADNLIFAGMQIVFPEDSQRDRKFQMSITKLVTQAYFEYEAKDYAEVTNCLDNLFDKLTSPSGNTTLGDRPVPNEVLDRLASDLQHKDPLKYPDFESARKAALGAECIQGSRDVFLSALHSGGIYRYRLIQRAYSP